MEKVKAIALILSTLTMSALVGYLVLAWTEPGSAPPTGNVSAPINVGSVQQWKEGGLGAGTKTFDLSSGQIAASTFYDRDNSSWYVNPAGTSVFSGNVGIGTTEPSAKLDIQGGDIKVGGTVTIKGDGTVSTGLNTGGRWSAYAPVIFSNTPAREYGAGAYYGWINCDDSVSVSKYARGAPPSSQVFEVVSTDNPSSNRIVIGCK